MAHTRISRPLLALLALAFAVRALVPMGWMPVRAADGVVLEICSGRTPGGTLQQRGAAQALLDKALAGTADHQQDDGSAKDPLCAFTGLGAAALAAPPLAKAATPPAAASVPPLPLTVSAGRGLPAPPPPATGPPLDA